MENVRKGSPPIDFWYLGEKNDGYNETPVIIIKVGIAK